MTRSRIRVGHLARQRLEDRVDHVRFDIITRVIGSRRSLIGGVAAAALTLASGALPETVAKKKKKKCKGGTIKCGKKLCVNASTDAQNCGSCGHRCGSGQACVSGVCTGTGPVLCPSGQIRCGGGCVDPEPDEAHCGSCGVKCASGETCSGGKCHAGSGYPCNDVYDCGGNYRGVVCRDGQCACENPAEGLCSDPRQGSYAICRTCCPGGNGNCPGDKVCNGPPSSTAQCECPVGKEQCAGSTNSHLCQANGHGAQDNRRCGVSCEDCTLRGPTSFCCFGSCQTACEANAPCDLKTCGGCQTCGEGTACCRSGTSNLFGCALLENGRCPGPPA